MIFPWQGKPVAIFSADRKKRANVLVTGTRLFGSKSQGGKLNTFRTDASAGPQSPGGSR